MMISETFAGGLIGRNGSNIERIRTESGATIKVFKYYSFVFFLFIYLRKIDISSYGFC